MTVPKPLFADRDQIALFVGAMLRHAKQGTIVALRAFRDDKSNKVFGVKWVWVGDTLDALTDAAAALATRAANAEYPVVFCPPVATFASKSAKLEALAQGLVLVVECDANPVSARRRLTEALGPPTLVVASGGQWTNPETGAVENKLHLYWRLSKPTNTAEEHDLLRLARELACRLVGADATAISIVHPLRWPGSWHRKADPVLCRIVEQNDIEIDLRTAVYQLQEQHGLDAMQERPDGRQGAPVRGAFPKLTDAQLFDLADRIPNHDVPWAEWNRLGMAFWGASDGSTAGSAAFVRWSQKSGKYDAESTDAKWRHYTTSPPTRIGAGTLVYLARQEKPAQLLNGGAPHPPEDSGDPEEADDAVDIAKVVGKVRLTDAGNAKRFARQHGCTVRYVAAHGRWFQWDGTRWRHDSTRAVYELAKATSFGIWDEVQKARSTNVRTAIAAWAKQSESRSRIDSMLVLAQSETPIATKTDDLDANPWLLNVCNGTVDLQTGKLGTHRREDLITKRAPCTLDSSTAAPLWTDFLNLIFAEQEELIAYIQRAVGYSLTGDVGEHVVFICHGSGENGKSTFLNTLLMLMGDYAVAADPELLMHTRGEKHPTGLARLNGARLVTAIESEEGRSFAEAQLKWMTGGDRLTARYMRGDFFEFDPTHKIWLATNHKPIIRGTDHAIWRRIHLIPFAVNIPRVRPKIKGFTDMLKAEWPGILRWAVQGCLAWQQEGLNPPPIVLAATQQYRSEMDAVGKFLDERCRLDPHASISAKFLYESFRSYCSDEEEILSQKAFGTRLTDRGIERKHSEGGTLYLGLRLGAEG